MSALEVKLSAVSLRFAPGEHLQDTAGAKRKPFNLRSNTDHDFRSYSKSARRLLGPRRILDFGISGQPQDYRPGRSALQNSGVLEESRVRHVGRHDGRGLSALSR